MKAFIEEANLHDDSQARAHIKGSAQPPGTSLCL
ncbi:hypothetical protein BBR47_48300 [Brevibacillus brevis NBRC 100599]|uniref:Uncharacterized protein n=1 Tax=Brevibacillus brevis (strain 47 / JCM 6285 / NBRC 100599) TaxID=358681 RepID=C0ZKY0_BREBN|nr:hypothetical protein BBR47_48300 [Brevibacillus brevis NBRC 100599]